MSEALFYKLRAVYADGASQEIICDGPNAAAGTFRDLIAEFKDASGVALLEVKVTYEPWETKNA